MTELREHFFAADGLRWNVCEEGQGATILLLHGTGASIHSWRYAMDLLIKTHHVIAIDLPGHGKTESRSSRDLALDRMARGVAAVLDVLKLEPQIVAGHSAGAAVLARMCAQKTIANHRYVSFNGAFYPIAGPFAALFSPIAKLMALNPFLPRFLSSVATIDTVRKLLRDTGSDLPPEKVQPYFKLFKDPKHVAGALGMMAAWDLRDVESWFSRIEAECIFVAGSRDKAVPPDTADRAAARCRNAKVLHLEGFGHLLHEEAPERAAAIIRGDTA
jgi:magnesium chelatase accessory protein